MLDLAESIYDTCTPRLVENCAKGLFGALHKSDILAVLINSVSAVLSNY